ncbi:MAG TPA: response regulator, partial [Acidimicrobiales bacterium]|nr:response regulator [Acidimicrobiales bacterium]
MSQTEAPIELLLVEDNLADARLVQEMLREASTGPVKLAHVETLGKALAYLESSPVSCVLLDLGLPDAMGREALLAIVEAVPCVPVVVLTGLRDESLGMAAVREGAQDYLAKSSVDPELLARSIRYAIERKASQEALAQRARMASFTAEVGLALTHGGTLESSLSRCAEAMVEHLGAAVARIWTLSDDEQTLELEGRADRLGSGASGAGVPAEAGYGTAALIASGKAPYVAEGLLENPPDGDGEWVLRERMVAFAGYPLLVGERLVGVISMFAHRPFSDAVLAALESASKAVALEMQRARADRQRERSDRELRLLQSVTLAASEAPDVSSALQVVIRKVCETTGWAYGQAWVPGESGRLTLTPSWYAADEGAAPFRAASEKHAFPPGMGLPGRVWASGCPAWIPDVSADANFPRHEAAVE